MEQNPRLTRHEREVLLGIPSLFPDSNSDDLKIPRASREAISYAIQHLIGLGLVNASTHQGVNPFAPYYRNVVLTTEGEELRRNLERWWVVQWLGRELKWLITTLIALCSLAMSLWNFFYPSAK